MSLSFGCPYCSFLPTVNSRQAGRSSQCPLCKQELILGPDSSGPFRLAAAPAPAPAAKPPRPRRPAVAFSNRALAGAALAALLLLAASGVAGILHSQRHPAARPTTVRLVAQADPEPAPRFAGANPSVASPPVADRALLRPDHSLAFLAEPAGKGTDEEHLRLLLADVPEVALDEIRAGAGATADARGHLRRQANLILERNAADADGAVLHLKKTRPDLAGMPWRLGDSCHLNAGLDKSLGTMSVTIRSALDSFLPLAEASSPCGAAAPAAPGDKVAPAWAYERFWWKVQQASNNHPEDPASMAVPALMQMVQPEHAGLRRFLVERLQPLKGKQVSVALARHAVFDLDGKTRGLALTALADRPEEEYAGVLVDGLRHPWAAAAENAAHALAVLRPRTVTERLVGLLDEPEPGAPFLSTVADREVPVVRELVRVNHFRNCMLCHPPSFSPQHQVRGAVPVPGESLSPGESMYGGQGPESTFVRADVTYLRQDFSVLQPVRDHGTWPERQRYDYLVRTRPLAEGERAAWEGRKGQERPRAESRQRRAVLYALCAVTGESAGPRAEDWRRLLGARSGAALADQVQRQAGP